MEHPKPEYVLRGELVGHEEDVRAVCAVPPPAAGASVIHWL